MKKTILKFTGLAALAALMMFNVQLFEADNVSGLSLVYLENMVFAQDEDPVYNGCPPGQLSISEQFTNYKICRVDGKKYWQDCTYKENSCCPMPQNEPPCGS